ncbi:MAG: acetate--CoA ligase [Methanothrix sp.]|uniref:acetate--CoA ligase n=1 Tax=Methanothrix sp. TaxID=90426 RepID=UPI0025F59211|nr:acetate--CoA ligase [Methanothrix sp.]MCQ8902791.1 acetate--CoA ligase [Methanothrix sp.]
MAEQKAATTAVLLEETRVFHPPKELAENSNVMQWMKKKGFTSEREMRAWTGQHYIEFWDEMAKTYADWFEPYAQILEWKPPYARWFVGGKCNVAYNAVDRHAKGAKKDKVAYIFVPEPTDQKVQKITYLDLYKAVNKFANGLKSLGVKKGDRVSIYMPMIPETPIAMLACAKIGAIHSVVFSGFSAGGLQSRVLDAESKVVVTTDGFYRRGKPLPLKPNVDEAVQNAPSVEKVVVVKRAGIDVPMKEGRDVWYHELVAKQPDECETEKTDSEDRLFILYTSGTTGKPKGIEHVHGGYCVGPVQTLHWVFDLKDNDVWWCTADVGWITGHSYVVYGPLCLGATSILYEGAPDYPDFGRWFSIIQEHKVSVLYTAPTAIRMFMKAGEQWPQKYDLSSLRLLGSVGEPINPEAWVWYRKYFGGDRCPIMDTWWQTETGCFVVSPLPITPLKPGSPTFPLPGFNTDIYDEDANPVPSGMGGNIVNTTPWPSMLRAFFRDPERYMKEYWQMYWDIRPGVYLAGDKATRDKDGYFFIQGRIDDVLKVAGHRISNAEVESALVSHPKVAEAAVIGKPDEVKGEVIVAFVILREGVQESEDLKKELAKHVRGVLGPVAYPEIVYFVKDVPKTRSGKIMRRVIKAKALGNPVGDISALANPDAVDAIPLIK